MDVQHKPMKVDEKKPDHNPGGISYVYVNGSPVIAGGEYLGGVRQGVVVLKK